MFKQNQEYIDLLIRHASLSKKPGYIKNSEFNAINKRLTQIEVEMPSQDIIQNTKIAFSN